MVPIETLHCMYNSIIQPHIDHCITVWGYAPDLYINKVPGLQNRAARIISAVEDFQISEIGIVKQCGWFTARNRRD